MAERIPSTGPNVVQIYLEEVGRHPLLTKEQEQELGAQVQAGLEAEKILQSSEGQHDDITQALYEEAVIAGSEAYDTMFVSNLRLVVSIARKYTGSSRSMELLDLIQEGNIGLGRAVEKFDPSKGFKFSTYASYWIKQGITRAILDKDTVVRVPNHVGSKIKAKRRHNVPLTEDEERALLISRVASYDKSLSSDSQPGENTLLDTLPDNTTEGELNDLLNKGLLDNIMTQVRMNEREVYILTKHFGLDGEATMTLEEISNELGITRQAVQQIQSRVFARCRKLFKKEQLAF
jgi:RNA polymerase primary sigma factor